MMHRVKARLVVQAVKKPYDPGYPAKLSDVELIGLLKTRSGSAQLRAAAVVACLASSLAAQEKQPTSQPVDRQSREAMVCSLLNKTMTENPSHHWLHDSKLDRRAIAGLPGHAIVRPFVPIMFGNSYSGLFDVKSARDHALRIFQAYGITLDTDVLVDEKGARGVIDGYSKEKKIGFEIKVEPSVGFLTRAAPVEPIESSGTALDESEIAALESKGRKLLFVPQSYYAVFDGDAVVANVYWIAAVTDFLNSVTDGPDIDITRALSGDFQWRSASTVVDAVSRKDLESRIERLPYAVEGRSARMVGTSAIVLDKTTRIRLLVERRPGSDAKDAAERRDGGTEIPPTTRRSNDRLQPRMILLTHSSLDSPDQRLDPRAGQENFGGRVTGIFQAKADGTTESVELGGSGVWTFFSPSTIDVDLPFEIEIELPSGRTQIPNAVYIR